MKGVLTGGIGFFDSGVGGLSVLWACRGQTAGLPIYYYGDNARAPYGNRSMDEIRAYTHEAFALFQRLRVRAAVVACNTVTATVIEELRNAYPFPIVGVEPAVLPAAKVGGRVLVLATAATASSPRLKKLIARAHIEYPQSKIIIRPCEHLAQRIERACAEGNFNLTDALPKESADVVVLGCTHYSLVRGQIADFYQAEVVDGNEAVARRLGQILRKGGIGADDRLPFSQKMPSKILPCSMLSNLSLFFPKRGRKNRRFQLKKCVCFQKLKIAQPLYFVGSGRAFNRQFYERMFAFGII